MFDDVMNRLWLVVFLLLSTDLVKSDSILRGTLGACLVELKVFKKLEGSLTTSMGPLFSSSEANSAISWLSCRRLSSKDLTSLPLRLPSVRS